MPRLITGIRGGQNGIGIRIGVAAVWLGCVVGLTVPLAAQSARPEPRPRAPGYRFGIPEDPPRRPAGRPAASGTSPDGLKTHLSIIVLMPDSLGPLDGQRWAKVFSDLNMTAQFRQPVIGDEVGVTETVRGTLRNVQIVGVLNANGTVELGGQVFSLSQGPKLEEWLNELKAYGAQGAPDSQPLWGLNEKQFDSVYDGLTAVVAEEIEDLSLNDALQKLTLPAAHPLRISTAADAWLEGHPAGLVKNRLKGFSTGTALAILLRESGLGFRPLRTPSGGVELSVEPLDSLRNPWPVGWDLEDDFYQSKIVPRLFQFVEIGFDEAALQDVLDACGAAIEVPIIVDEHGVKTKRVDLETFLVSYPKKKTTWSLMLNSVILKAGLKKVVRTDEAQKPFVYVTPSTATTVAPTR